MQLDDAVIDRSAEEGSRQVALALLGECGEAARRLAKPSDDEALHDFRVGLRRLRTVLRAFAPWLEASVQPRDPKRLRKLARASNAARDAQVHLAFLASQAPHGSARRRAGLEFLQGRLEARRREGAGVGRLVARYERISRKLAERMPRYEVRLDEAPSRATFGAALAAVLGEALASVRARIAGIAGPADEPHVHKARIAVKRLRYLLEPLRGNALADARGAVGELKRLQEVLGDLHDAHTLAHDLEAALLEAAAERTHRLFAAVYGAGARGAALRDQLRGGPRAGLLALVRIVRERRDGLFAELERAWRADGLAALAAEVERLTTALEQRAGGRVEIQRRYLLTALPPRAEGGPQVEIAIGWLPGEPVRERLRTVRAADGERYWRGFIQGEGVHRLQVEEETSGEVFEALWPLTEGRRETRRRREVSDGGVTWWIDELAERHAIVAETQLLPHAAGAPIPDWLRPWVVRELTEDPSSLPAEAAGAEAGSRAPAAEPAAAAGEGALPADAAPPPH
ncbi:CHAD domain-containing protein [Anaeromyxobacter diazotrophicus]|uniref:CHAD domain-containing protein n=1 Tax=Anaeromyxobacter diazotrophicus TaxID=2590199 RepID=A0A7I9VGD9_9BACT|nr:CHAD domain-containing protein [Anaeromyxobacter diazotrophicus]GEJ55464.1 hypothetical protein AMYX_02050 [Anaeromyxobacter diazotrophicus]